MQFMYIQFVADERLRIPTILDIPDIVFNVHEGKSGWRWWLGEAVDDGYKIKRETMMPSIFTSRLRSSSSVPNVTSHVLLYPGPLEVMSEIDTYTL